MTAPSWPPESNYPIVEWTDDELIDRYRHVKAQTGAEHSDYLDSDDDVAALIQELIRRGLDDLAEAVEDHPSAAGREPT
jgi:hypothetical protein